VHYEISPIFQKACQNLYPNLVFLKKERETHNYVKINSSRFKHYIEVINDHFIDGDNVLIIDCDTLILKDFSSVYSEKFDIGFTYKITGFPINFGVIFGKISVKFRETINYIYDDLKITLESKRLLKFATSISGAADQHSINKLVNTELLTPDKFSPALRKKHFENTSELNINNRSVSVKFFDCDADLKIPSVIVLKIRGSPVIIHLNNAISLLACSWLMPMGEVMTILLFHSTGRKTKGRCHQKRLYHI